VPSRHPYLDTDGPIAIAHRGGASERIENTMEAFAHAVALGYRYVETDVRVTADGVALAFHDDDLRRACGRSGRISQLTWDEVRDLRVHGSAPIPLLEDVLGAWPHLRINIDCKSDMGVAPLLAAIRRTDAFDRVCVAAFSDRRLARLRALAGGRLCTSLGPGGLAALRAGRLRRTAARAAQVPVRRGPITVTTPSFVARAHVLGLAVHVWTIDDEATMARLLDLGVDGIMTDRPTALRAVLERRRQWR
jgi:glycerophosphoryl diester phosphodiesterase